ncbi:MAG: nitroreductase family protein [Thaumarchaeota archaeon]|nr:nitroreductase family protein [Nitrososphaerota archaeon]MBI3116175.1 nitroreductase family protein [Nitrososphaerota archaeon]
MDAYETVRTKLDVREFAKKKVPASVKSQILEAARLTQSGNNTQHWRFILVQDPANLKTLAKDSKWGKWVENADFAIIVLTDPQFGYHLIDAGRVVQDMELTAWGSGVASCVFTGLDEEAYRRDFNIQKNLTPSIVVGFGYPAKKLLGKKNRKPLSELAFLERYGSKFSPDKLS